jgi:hypothetical protein
MKWQCALLQRWLPEYPDGDLPAWGKRWLTSHVARCPDCRQELADLRELVTGLESAPMADPGPEFWQDFSRQMHLQLVQAAASGQTEPTVTSPRRWRVPYLLGAPAVAVLLVWVAVNLTGPGTPVPEQAQVMRPAAPKLAAVPPPAPAMSRQMAIAPANEEIVPAALSTGASPPVEEVDLSGWDLDAELAEMTDQEKEVFLKKLHQQQKDGSCTGEYSFCSWG